MAVWPNGLRTAAGWQPYRHFGRPDLQWARPSVDNGSRRGPYVGPVVKTSSVPEGYGPGGGVVLPYISGGMAGQGRQITSLGQTGDLIKGGPVDGSWTMTLGQSGALSLVIEAEGSWSATITGDGLVLALTIGLGGTGTWALTGDGVNLASIVPADGSWSAALTGSADLRSRLSLAGEFTPFTELSPQSLADAVWSAIAADNNQTGSMGEKLNGAGSAGNPWTETIEGSLSAASVLRILLAVLAGKTEITDFGSGAAEVRFKDLAGMVDRVTATMAGSERTTVDLDGSTA